MTDPFARLMTYSHHIYDVDLSQWPESDYSTFLSVAGIQLASVACCCEDIHRVLGLVLSSGAKPWWGLYEDNSVGIPYPRPWVSPLLSPRR
jgi:hypothetical protein